MYASVGDTVVPKRPFDKNLALFVQSDSLLFIDAHLYKSVDFDEENYVYRMLTYAHNKHMKRKTCLDIFVKTNIRSNALLCLLHKKVFGLKPIHLL